MLLEFKLETQEFMFDIFNQVIDLSDKVKGKI